MRRVVKLGGSLLEWPHVRSSLRAWMARQPPMSTALVVGGGAWVETLRRLDQRFTLGEEAAHWLAIRALGVTARLASTLWPEFALVARFEDLTQRHGPVVFDAEDFLRREETLAPGVRLARDWTVTSDSIAARVAVVLGAEELVLLKSTLPERTPLTRHDAAETGYVDPFFPRAANELPHVRAVNLRDAAFRETVLLG